MRRKYNRGDRKMKNYPSRFNRLRNAIRWLPVLMLLIGGVVLSISANAAHAQLRVVTYNVADLEGNQSSFRFVLQALMEDPAPTTGTVRAPDIFTFQEVTVSSANTIRNNLNALNIPNTLYELATFTTNGGGGENALIYNSLTIVEDQAGHRDITNHTGPRATDRWKLSVIGQFGGLLYVYSSHFKANTGTTNEDRRASEANAVRNDADALGPGVNILYTGDFNLYHNGEPAYQRLIEAGNGAAIDPRFNHNFSSAITHTQSPHDGTGGLVTGGMDDRFDFIIGTAALLDNLGIDYDPMAYRSFGNDGQHYNKAINDGFNSYFLESEQALKADALAKASDHLPIVVDLFLLDGDHFVQEIPPLIAGALTQWSVRGATPNNSVFFVYSLAGFGEYPVPNLNVTLRLQNPKLATRKNAKPNGNASFIFTPPNSFQDKPIYFQSVQHGMTTDVILRVVE